MAPLANLLLTKFETCSTIPVLKPWLVGMSSIVPDLPTMSAKIDDAANALIETTGEKVPEKLDERLAEIEKIMADRRSETFPVHEFECKELAGWNTPPLDIWTRLDSYLDEREKVDEETRQLVALFEEALNIPAISGITKPVDCPLCSTESALTPERVQLIRQNVENSKDFKTAETAAKSALSELSASAEALATAAKDALPSYLKTTPAVRREMGFTVSRIRELLDDRAAELADPWLALVRPLARAETALYCGALTAGTIIEEETAVIATALDREKIYTAFSSLATLRDTYSDAINAYKAPDFALKTVLNEVLDAHSDIVGWQDFIDIARVPDMLRAALLERNTCETVGKELDAALKQIDHAKEQVLNDKFSDYSSLINVWWERLRPDEQTFFSAVKLRKGAKRTIDIKAGLSTNTDRSTLKVRDVIAIFSHSQLHCLGLAMFLARVEHEGLGFIILDDPVLSSDKDYRVHFNSTVLTELLKLPMQVVVLTQDHDIWKELENRYRHRGISNAQLYIETPVEGSIIENTSDSLLAKINRAKILARGGHPDSRKECGIHLRDAGERFCKEMLVKDEQERGNTAASLSDYDSKTLEWLCPRVDPLLDHDASHPGKLNVFKNNVNNACHDNEPPSTVLMKQACGEIRFLVKDYLCR